MPEERLLTLVAGQEIEIDVEGGEPYVITILRTGLYRIVAEQVERSVPDEDVRQRTIDIQTCAAVRGFSCPKCGYVGQVWQHENCGYLPLEQRCGAPVAAIGPCDYWPPETPPLTEKDIAKGWTKVEPKPCTHPDEWHRPADLDPDDYCVPAGRPCACMGSPNCAAKHVLQRRLVHVEVSDVCGECGRREHSIYHMREPDMSGKSRWRVAEGGHTFSPTIEVAESDHEAQIKDKTQ